ncbi:hypothetical protein Tco_1273010 [Tanacetum coccineum]
MKSTLAKSKRKRSLCKSDSFLRNQFLLSHQQSPFTQSSQNSISPSSTQTCTEANKDFEANTTNQGKTGLDLQCGNFSKNSKSLQVKNQGLIVEAYEWDEEEVSSDDNETVRKILGVDQLTEDPSSSGKKDLVLVKSLADDTNMSIPNVERPWLSETEEFNLPNRNTFRILPSESQVKVTNSLVNVTDS